MSFFTKTKLESLFRLEGRLLRRALLEARNSNSVSREDRGFLEPRDGKYLRAVNPWSRIVWSKAVCKHLEAFFCTDEQCASHSGTVYLVTLADITCATSTVAPLDVDRARGHLRAGLSGTSYVGFVEPAYYTNLQAGVRFREKRCIFWHLHALVWGISERKLRLLIKKLNSSDQYVSIGEGFKAAHARKIRRGDLPFVVGYILKPPTNAYRVARYDVLDSEGRNVANADGEIVAQFKQYKSQLRKGERITLFHAMKKFYLDQLAVSGGEGRTLLAKAKRDALDHS